MQAAHLFLATPAMAQGQQAVVDACRSLEAIAGAVCLAHVCNQGLEGIEHYGSVGRSEQGSQVLYASQTSVRNQLHESWLLCV